MAVLAAFLLVAATAASTGTSLSEATDTMTALTAGAMLDKQQAEAQPGPVRSVRHNKRFKISLYLFRRN